MIGAGFEGLNSAAPGFVWRRIWRGYLRHVGPLVGPTIKTVIEGDSVPEEFIPYLIELNAKGQFPDDAPIQRFPFDEINQAVAASAAATVVKPCLCLTWPAVIQDEAHLAVWSELQGRARICGPDISVSLSRRVPTGGGLADEDVGCPPAKPVNGDIRDDVDGFLASDRLDAGDQAASA